MHSLKILPLPPALPRHRCSPYQTVLSRHPPRGPHSGPSASQSAAASALCAVSLPSQFPHPARRYRGSCVMAGVGNVQRSFVGVV